jgi:hypothetical protein
MNRNLVCPTIPSSQGILTNFFILFFTCILSLVHHQFHSYFKLLRIVSVTFLARFSRSRFFGNLFFLVNLFILTLNFELKLFFLIRFTLSHHQILSPLSRIFYCLCNSMSLIACNRKQYVPTATTNSQPR